MVTDESQPGSDAFCTHCGHRLTEGDVACAGCGTVIDPAPPPSTPPPPPSLPGAPPPPVAPPPPPPVAGPPGGGAPDRARAGWPVWATLGLLAAGLVVVVALVVVFVVVGGGDDDESAGDTSATTRPVAEPDNTAAPTTEPTGLVIAGVDFGIVDLPAGEPYEQYARVVDDTGAIQVEAPTAWSDTETAPYEDVLEDGRTATVLVVAATMPAGSELPPSGVGILSDSLADSDAEELDEFAEGNLISEDCADSRRFDYDDGSYTGLADLWTGCYDEGLSILLISITVDGVNLFTQVWLTTDADIDATRRVIETFSFTGQ